MWNATTLAWDDQINLTNVNVVTLVAFRCTVANIGSVDLTGVEVWDDLDSIFTNITALPAEGLRWGGIPPTPTTLYWNLGNLPAGTTQTYDMTATIPAGIAVGNYTNDQRARGNAGGNWLFDTEDAIVRIY